MARLRATAAELGLPLGERKMTYNSRLAQELGCWAETKAKGHDFHDAAFKVYFVDGLNIAKIPVLLDLAESVGLDRKEAEKVLVERTYKDQVDQEWALSRQLGVTAVPTFVMGLSRLVGAQPYQALEKLVQSGGIQKRS